MKLPDQLYQKNGLSVIQQELVNDSDQTVLHTILCHSSGQWIQSRVRLAPPSNELPIRGSYVNFIKRSSYATLVGVVAQDEDDDGERTRKIPKRAILIEDDPNINEPTKKLTKEQYTELQYEIKGNTEIAQQIMHAFKIDSLADIPQSKFKTAISRVREIIRAIEGL